MKLSKISLMIVALAFAAFGTACATQSKAEQAKTDSRNEMMAKMHEQMAGCLRSGKSPQECRSEVQKDCPMMKDGTCPMMGEMMGSGGMMGQGMMSGGMMGEGDSMEKKKSASAKKAETKDSKGKSKTNTDDHEEHH